MMLWNRKIIITLFVLWFGFSTYAQGLPKDKDVAIAQILDYLSENEEDNINLDALSANLSYLYDHPINLNHCTADDLSELPIFTPVVIMNIIDYQQNNNGFVSIYELKLIEGFTDELIKLSVPFLSTPKRANSSIPLTFKNVLRFTKHSLITRYQRVLQKQPGYLLNSEGEIPYLGSPDRLYTRYQLSSNQRLKAGFTLDKDAGEPFFKAPNQQGFDFYSGFIQLKNQGVVKNLVVGDYALQMGQGLALWNGFGMRKSTMVMNVTKFGKGIDKYASADENKFFRGIATTLQYRQSELSVFFSSKKRDGSIQSDTLHNQIEELNAIDQTGLHATLSDFDKKHKFGEKVYGLSYLHRFNRLKIGAVWVGSEYSIPLKQSDKLYQKHNFYGRKNYNLSFFYQWNLNHVFCAGEIATDPHLNIALTNHMLVNVSSKLGLVLLHRYFDYRYQSLFSSAFSEGTKVQNENGFYAGFQFLATRKWIFKAYIDYYRFPWLKYQISKPSSGLDYLVVGEYQLSRHFNAYFKYKNESRLKDLPLSDTTLKQQQTENKQQLRLHFDYGNYGGFKFKTRVEWSWYQHQKKERGLLAYQDVMYQWQTIPLRTTFRFLTFDTEGYASRIYTFENELLYNFYIPAFSGKGIRAYCLIKYQIVKNLDVWMKYGITVYHDRQTIGSGNNTINGDTKSDIKLQLRYRF